MNEELGTILSSDDEDGGAEKTNTLTSTKNIDPPSTTTTIEKYVEETKTLSKIDTDSDDELNIENDIGKITNVKFRSNLKRKSTDLNDDSKTISISSNFKAETPIKAKKKANSNLLSFGDDV